MSRIQNILDSRCGKILLVICRLLLGITFVYSGLGKIVMPAEFADAVVKYRILPTELINVFAITLPWVELLCGLSLINGIALRSSAFLVAIMNLMFISAAISALARGLNIECGCKSLAETSSKLGWGLIVKDFVLLLLCIPLIVQRKYVKRK